MSACPPVGRKLVRSGWSFCFSLFITCGDSLSSFGIGLPVLTAFFFCIFLVKCYNWAFFSFPLILSLHSEGRMIDYIHGDGNCFFLVINISKDIDGSENAHEIWRNQTCNEFSTHPQHYERYVENMSVAEHVRRMRQPKRWPTTCEMYGTAQVLRCNVYVFSPPTDDAEDGAKYKWFVFQPRASSLVKLSPHPPYFTICHTHGNHFDKSCAYPHRVQL